MSGGDPLIAGDQFQRAVRDGCGFRVHTCRA
jgi:hypothetical protein